MRVVADTNTVISALFWRGAPRLLLDAARTGSILLFTSAELLAELEEVLVRPKFAPHLNAAETSASELVVGYASLARRVQPTLLRPVINSDPDDDMVLACAVAARADWIATGDQHLLTLDKFRRIRIANAHEILTLLKSQA